MKFSLLCLSLFCGGIVACIPVTHSPGVLRPGLMGLQPNSERTAFQSPKEAQTEDSSLVEEPSAQAIPLPSPEMPLALPDSEKTLEPSVMESPESSRNSHYSSSSGGSSSGGHQSSASEDAVLSISDILLTETQQSILATQDAAFLSGSVSKGTPLKITLKGVFPESFISQETMRFTHEAGLLRQTHAKGELPTVYVLMDDVLLWEPTNVSSHSIELEVNSKDLISFALSGEHTLALITPEGNIEKQILLKTHEDDENNSVLAPRILSGELIQSEEKQYLKVSGYNFPLAPALAAVTIDAQTYPVVYTQIFTDGRSESFIELGEDFSLTGLEEAFFIYETPFGYTMEKLGSLL